MWKQINHFQALVLLLLSRSHSYLQTQLNWRQLWRWRNQFYEKARNKIDWLSSNRESQREQLLFRKKIESKRQQRRELRKRKSKPCYLGTRRLITIHLFNLLKQQSKLQLTKGSKYNSRNNNNSYKSSFDKSNWSNQGLFSNQTL